ncbi:hypothetical protein [Fusibacter bizertensis]
MHKMDLFAAIFDYIENLFSKKLSELEKQSIKDSFEKINIEDGIERAIRAIELGLHIKLPHELFVETRGHVSHDPIELILHRLNFEASMWTNEYHSGIYQSEIV